MIQFQLLSFAPKKPHQTPDLQIQMDPGWYSVMILEEFKFGNKMFHFIQIHTELFLCRRKKSLQRNQILAEDDQLCAELRLKTQPAPFIPELRNSLESEKQDLDGFAASDSKENNMNSEDTQGETLVKPSDIRKFVRSNSKHKIELK